ncbi:MAG: SLC13 family permease [Halanaeroarchaeum sp.]
MPEGSRLLGETVEEANLAAYHNAHVLAVRRGDAVLHEGVGSHEIALGDSLLVQVRERDLRYLVQNGDVVVVRGVGLEEVTADPTPLSSRTPLVLATVAGVVAIAALGLLPVPVAALGGAVVLLGSGTLSPADAYGAVNWNVVFLLAGLLPLGIALTTTGGDAVVADAVAGAAGVLPPIAVLGLFYLATSALASVITPVASVVLLVPVAIDVAVDLGATPLAFVVIVLFGANTAFSTPIGYQTNLMVYGPGGYRFTDYLRVGVPLQALLAVVTTLAVAGYWGL